MKSKKKLEEFTAEALIYELLADKLGTVDPKEVFFAKSIDAGKDSGKYSALLGGKKITPNQLTSLQQEALLVMNTEWWKLVTNTLRHEAELRMFKMAKTERDMDWGKAILHSIGIIEHITKAIKYSIVEEAPKPFQKPS